MCLKNAGPARSVGFADLYSGGHWFDPWVRPYIFHRDFSHETFMAIFFLPLIQEGQLSLTGESMGI